VIIPRIQGYFRLKEAIVHRSWGFRGFNVEQVQAAYRKNNPCDGYGVALVLQSSQVDLDFKVPTLFLREDELRSIREAMRESDRLTERILGRGWSKGPRPYVMLHHIITGDF